MHLCGGRQLTDLEVLATGTVFTSGELDNDVRFTHTGVVRADGKVWRVITTRSDDGLQYHQITADQEESLIQAAIKEHPGLKPSFTRWATLSKSNKWPAMATESELAFFGRHCCVSGAFVEAKQAQKRNRDAASRKRRTVADGPDCADATNMTVTFTGAPPAVWEAMRACLRSAGGAG